MRRDLLQLFYLVSAILFVMGLRGLSHPKTARRGMFLAELGMLLAIIGSLLHHEIIDYRWIAAGLVLGTAIGVAMGIAVEQLMNAMLFNAGGVDVLPYVILVPSMFLVTMLANS